MVNAIKKVFKVELLPIQKAAEWGNTTGQDHGILSDCMLAIQELSKPFNV